MLITIIKNGKVERFDRSFTPQEERRQELIEQRRQRAKEYHQAGLTLFQSVQAAQADFAHKFRTI